MDCAVRAVLEKKLERQPSPCQQLRQSTPPLYRLLSAFIRSELLPKHPSACVVTSSEKCVNIPFDSEVHQTTSEKYLLLLRPLIPPGLVILELKGISWCTT